MLLLLALALQDAKESEFRMPELGIRLRMPPGFDLCIDPKKFKFKNKSACCEIQSSDGRVRGTLTYWGNVGSPILIADKREAGVNDPDRKVKRVLEEEVKRPGLTGLRRDFVVTAGRSIGKEPQREVLAIGARGNRLLELRLWLLESDWEAHREGIGLLVESLEFRRIWKCPACGAEIEANSVSCKGCSTSYVVPDSELQAWAKKHSVQIVTDPKGIYPLAWGTTKISGATAPKEAVEAYCRVLRRELLRYPPEAIEKMGVERIVLSKDLSQGQVKVSGLGESATNTVHLDVFQWSTQPETQAGTVHHELFHMLDQHNDLKARDKEWEALNAPGAKYMNRRDSSPEPTEANPGFFSTYSMTAVEEDKAEVFANLMVRPKLAAERCAKDEYLRKKAERIKASVRAWCPALNEKFWESK